MITITSKQHLFRRCGVAHPKGATEYPDERFTDAELKIMSADPMLRVEIVTAKPDTSVETVTAAKRRK